MKKLIIALITTIFLGCSNTEELGSNYYYLSDYDAMDIGHPYGSLVYKSSNVNIFENCIIFSDIKRINFDDKYIIVNQKPNSALMIKKIEHDIEFWNDYYLKNKKDSLIEFDYRKIPLTEIHNLIEKKGIENISKIADSVFNNEMFYKKVFKREDNYYIINKKNDSIFGPLALKEFLSIKKKKRIELDF